MLATGLDMRRIAIALALISTPAFAGKQTDRTRAAELVWGNCVISNARSNAGRADAPSIVEAAFGVCGAEEDAFRTAVLKYSQCGGWCGGYTRAALDAEMDHERQTIKGPAFAAVIAALPPHP